jgi:L-lactate dehydrogenase (cytochrome)
MPEVNASSSEDGASVRDALYQLQSEACLDAPNPVTVPPSNGEPPPEADKQLEKAREALPPVEKMIVLPDFEVWAKKVLPEVAWNYYRSAADQERCND